jgi:hypothetical protein
VQYAYPLQISEDNVRLTKNALFTLVTFAFAANIPFQASAANLNIDFTKAASQVFTPDANFASTSGDFQTVFQGSWGANAVATGSATLDVIDPATSNLLKKLSFAWTSSGMEESISVSVISGAVTPGDVMVDATGGPVAIAPLLFGSPAVPSNLTVQLTATPTPEPASIAMIGAGILALGGVALRRRTSL